MILLLIPLVAAAFVPRLLLRWRRRRQQLLAAHQLRESLELMVNALKSGVGLSRAIAYAADEIPPPLGGEWRRVLESVRLGSSWADAVAALRHRHDSPEIRWFVMAVQITQSTGGSLAVVLETLCETLRERQNLRDRIGALTAQGKASGFLLSALPFLILLALEWIAPGLAAPMFTTWTGQCLLLGVVVLLSFGGWMIRNIVTIPVER